MSDARELMRERLHGFTAALAAAGIRPDPRKLIDFFTAVAATAPPHPRRLYWTARVTLLGRIDDVPTFDRVFAQWFGEVARVSVPAADRRPSGQVEPAPNRPGGLAEPASFSVREGKGREASVHELLREGAYAATAPEQQRVLREIRHALRCRLPETRARRRVSSRHVSRLHLRRVARSAARTGGEVTRLYWRDRPGQPRRVLMLIDVSGSLRATSPDALRCAHAVVRVVPRSEAYTFGTRLTRVTRALRGRDPDAALDKLAEVVTDVNGGTRIGASLDEFLADSRRASAARDAVVIVVSDGLERGDPALMAESVARLARLAYRLVWWSPLACDPAYRPVTRGMAAIIDDLDDLVGVRDLPTALAAVERLPALELEWERAVRTRRTSVDAEVTHGAR
jgi:uncharacterized protein with von Willebrand factor type A (vWA) domain